MGTVQAPHSKAFQLEFLIVLNYHLTNLLCGPTLLMSSCTVHKDYISLKIRDTEQERPKKSTLSQCHPFRYIKKMYLTKFRNANGNILKME